MTQDWQTLDTAANGSGREGGAWDFQFSYEVVGSFNASQFPREWDLRSEAERIEITESVIRHCRALAQLLPGTPFDTALLPYYDAMETESKGAGRLGLPFQSPTQTIDAVLKRAADIEIAVLTASKGPTRGRRVFLRHFSPRFHARFGAVDRGVLARIASVLLEDNTIDAIVVRDALKGMEMEVGKSTT